jgi:hypothetical protein
MYHYLRRGRTSESCPVPTVPTPPATPWCLSARPVMLISPDCPSGLGVPAAACRVLAKIQGSPSPNLTSFVGKVKKFQAKSRETGLPECGLNRAHSCEKTSCSRRCGPSTSEAENSDLFLLRCYPSLQVVASCKNGGAPWK